MHVVENFASFQGNEIALFVANIPVIIEFLNNNFIETSELKSLVKSLNLWVEIFRFLGVTHVRNEEEYSSSIQKFKVNVIEFYKYGEHTFLSSPGRPGKEETFYTHALRFYLPSIVEITFERHQLGVGIFNMQGFERRNKESKNCMKRFSNNKGNAVVNNIKRLYDVFKYNTNGY